MRFLLRYLSTPQMWWLLVLVATHPSPHAGRRRGAGNPLARSAAVGVCIHGLIRTIASHAVATTFREHILTSLARQDFEVETHVHLAGGHCGCPRSHFKQIRGVPNLLNGKCPCERSLSTGDEISKRKAIATLYTPVSFSFQPDDWCASCVGLPDARNASFQPPYAYTGDPRSLPQFVTAAACFDAIEEREKVTKRQYTWIVRLRSDFVFYNDLRLEGLSRDHVYIPAAGMSEQLHVLCNNDQAFICPRSLCSPYFRHLELLKSEVAKVTHSAPVFLSALRRYIPGDHPPAVAEPMHPLHCRGGQTRLFHLAFSLARGNKTHGGLQCHSHKNLWLGPLRSTRHNHLRGNIGLKAQLQDFARALNLSTEVSETYVRACKELHNTWPTPFNMRFETAMRA